MKEIEQNIIYDTIIYGSLKFYSFKGHSIPIWWLIWLQLKFLAHLQKAIFKLLYQDSDSCNPKWSYFFFCQSNQT